MPITNSIVVRYAGGYRTATVASSVSSYGKREGFLSLSSTEEITSADSALLQELASQAFLQEAVVLGIEPLTDGDTPYLGVWVRDEITAPDASGTATAYRVLSLSGSVDDEGWATFTPELETTTDTVSDRTKLWLKRLGDGTFAGRSAKATLVRPLGAQVLEGKVSPVVPPPFSQGTLAIESSPQWQAEVPFRLTQIDATLQTPGTTSTTVVVKKNGSTVVTLTLPAGRYHVVDLPVAVTFTQTDYLNVATTVKGTGAKNLLVTFVGGPRY